MLPGTPSRLPRKTWLILGQFEVTFGQLLDVDVLEGDDPHVLYEPCGPVHVPYPRVVHGDLEKDLAVVRAAYLEIHVVSEIEPSLGLHDMGEQADNVAVLAVELQLHLRFVLFQVFRAHDSPSPSTLPNSPSTRPGSGTHRNDLRCSGHGPNSASARRCSSVTYPL